MGRRGSEEWFERRVQRRFEKIGCVVLNISRSRPVDLLVFPPPPSQSEEIWPVRPVMVEVKARNTRAPDDQLELQKVLAKRAGCNLIRLRQGRLRGTIRLEYYMASPPDDEGSLAVLLNRAFGDMWRRTAPF